MASTKIEWTDENWNPTNGCAEVSPGCDNCYAKARAERLRGTIGFPRGFDPYEKPHKLGEPLRGKAGRMFFVNSMSDLFHREFRREYLAAVFGVMATAQTKKHVFQILTKRPERALAWFQWLERHWADAWDRFDEHGGEPPLRRIGRASEPDKPLSLRDAPGWQGILCAAFAQQAIANSSKPSAAFECGMFSSMLGSKLSAWPLPNVWMGVSIENERVAERRLAALRQIPAAIRFVSAEPLLGPLGAIDFTGIDWVIIGGESGPNSRPMEVSWALEVIAAARAAGAAVFVKQLGAHWAKTRRAKHRKGGDPHEWPADLRIREFPKLPYDLIPEPETTPEPEPSNA